MCAEEPGSSDCIRSHLTHSIAHLAYPQFCRDCGARAFASMASGATCVRWAAPRCASTSASGPSARSVVAPRTARRTTESAGCARTAAARASASTGGRPSNARTAAERAFASMAPGGTSAGTAKSRRSRAPPRSLASRPLRARLLRRRPPSLRLPMRMRRHHPHGSVRRHC